MKSVLITGILGFIGLNLRHVLSRRSDIEIVGFDIHNDYNDLEDSLKSANIIIHLAGINRSEKEREYEEGNTDLTRRICNLLEKNNKNPLLVFSSSTQAVLDNPYGRSKRKAEEALLELAGRLPVSVLIYRLPGVFGKWCRPNYNSVVATFCHNIARGIPIEISDPKREIELVHVDDVVSAFIGIVKNKHDGATFCDVSPVFKIELGELAKILGEFNKCRESLRVLDMSDPFLRKLFGTYMSYLPSDGFAYDLDCKADQRGVLAEVLKANGHGQFFVSRTKPGVVRGNHYHDRKVEKFLVLEGEALIRFRNLATGEITEYPASGRKLRLVDIPPGWTHSIQNVGSAEMITLFWASEVFNADNPDTYPAEV